MDRNDSGGEGRLTVVLDRAMDLIVVVLAVWTLVFLGGLWIGGTRLQVALVAAVTAVPAAWWVIVRGRREAIPAESPRVVMASRAGVIAVGFAVAATVLVVRGYDTLFWVAAVCALIAAWLALRTSAASGREISVRTGAAVVLVVATLSAMLSATQIDWVQDNTYYVDRALAIRDAPGALPVGRDSFYTPDGRYPSIVPENDLAALEGLVGTVSAYAGGHPMSWLSYVVHPAFAFLGVVALWRAARGLGSRRPYLVATFGTIAVYLLSLQSEIGTRTFSSRTGRNGFVAVLVPLLVAYTIELVRSPGAASAVRFVAAGVVSGGFTLSALPVVPVVVLGAGIAVWRSGSTRRQRLWIGGAAVLVLVYFVALTVAAFLIGRSPIDMDGAVVVARSPGELWQASLGPAHAYIPLTIVLLAGWALVPGGVLRRFVVAAPLVSLLVALGPLSLWALSHTAAATAIVRLGWSIPLGLLVGAVVAGVWESFPGVSGRIAAIGLLAVELLAVTQRPVPRLALPGWDVPGVARSAERLVALAPEGGVVAASWSVSALVPVLTNEVYAVGVYRGSIDEIGLVGDPAWEPEARHEVMSWMMDGAMGREPNRFVAALDTLGVDALCFREVARSDGLRLILKDSGFARAGTDRTCQFWVRQE